MVRAAVHGLYVYIGARAACEALEEIRHEFRLQIAYKPGAHLGVTAKAARPLRSTAAMARVSSIGMRKYPVAQDATLSPRARSKASPSADAYVLYGVMLVHIEIAIALECEIECDA